MEFVLKSIIYIGLVAISQSHDLKDFESSVLYNIEWPGPSLGKTFEEFEKDGYESMVITTEDMETYKCMIPPPPAEKTQKESDTTNLSPLNVLSPIFSSKICSYRFENYWSYELCHGHHIKQYHEERDGKNVKIQEYYLGSWNDAKMKELEEQLSKDMDSGKAFKTTKIDNIKYPYFEIEMSDGTSCDLINQPRVTRVRYICYPHGKNEIFSLKETSTCNYEMIVLTSALCMLPAFLPETSVESEISCIPVDDTPEKPLSWLVNKVEDIQLRYKPVPDAVKAKDSIAIIKVDTKDGTFRVDIISPKQDEKLLNPEAKEDDDEITPASDLKSNDGSAKLPTALPKIRPPRDMNPILEFLKGENCLTGGSGWWQYEFCYGKYIRQFHDKTEDKKSQILGYFEEKAHRQWLKENPQKRPLPKNIRTHVTHFYHDGTICDKTGEKRQTEVKLKCGGINSLSPSAVSMFLLEPEICKYVLTIESKLICDILKAVDDDGLVPDMNMLAELAKEELDSSSSSDGTIINGDRKSGTESRNRGESKGDGVYAGNIIVEDIEVRYEND